MSQANASRSIPVAPTTGMSLWLLWVILLATVLILLGLTINARGLEGLATTSVWLGPVIVLLAGAVLSFAYRRRQLVLDPPELLIRSTFYTRRTSLGSMQLDRARVVDLAEHTELKPAIKTNGFAMPGFMSGHYRMRDGGKAFCLVTDYSRVLVLPLRDGSLLLLSPEQPRALLDELKRLAERHRAA